MSRLSRQEEPTYLVFRVFSSSIHLVAGWLALLVRRAAAVPRRVAVPALACAALASGIVPPLAASASTEGASARSGARVIFLVQQAPQLDAALKTGKELLSGKHLPAREVEVVVCGPAIDSLVAGAPLSPALDDAASRGIRVVACGLSLAQKHIDPAGLHPKVAVVENGLVEVLLRKAEGFLSVEL
jgi:intracellular sulfur oxidation DsrE/DsrF family protein